MRSPINLATAFVVVAVLTLPAIAAEGPVIDTLRYRVTPLPGDLLGVAGASADDKGMLRGMFQMQGEHNPIFLVVDPDRDDPVVADRLVGELGLTFGLGKGVALWTGLPFVAYQAGWWPTPEDRIQSWGPGDIRVGGHFTVLDPEKMPVGIALRPGVQAPTGVRQAFASSGVVELLGHVGVETRRLGPVRVGGVLGARITPPQDWVGVEVYPAFNYGLAVDVQVHRRWNVNAAWAGEVAGSEWENPMELRLGGRFAATEGVDLGAVMGWAVTPGVGAPDFRFGFNVTLGLPTWKEKAPVQVVQSEPQPVVTPARVAEAATRTGYAEILMPSPVRFREGETRLRREAQDALVEVVDYLRKHPELRPVLVLGHGDGRGGAEYNAALSRRRAVATREYLVGEGGLTPELLSVPEESPLDGPVPGDVVARESIGFILGSGS